jgi:signal transduction histidine kinase
MKRQAGSMVRGARPPAQLETIRLVTATQARFDGISSRIRYNHLKFVVIGLREVAVVGQQSFLTSVLALWRVAHRAMIQLVVRWTEPQPDICDLEERLQARLLAAFTSLTFFFGLIGLLLQLAQPTRVLPLNLWVIPGSLMNYTLSRSRYYRVGVFFYTVASFVLMYLAVQSTAAPQLYAIGMAVPLMIAGMFWRPLPMTAWVGLAVGCVIWVIGFEPANRYLLYTTLLFLIMPTLGSVYITHVRQRYQKILVAQTERLTTNEARYHNLFEAIPVSLWEEDFSEVKSYLNTLREQGVDDLVAYLHTHPDVVLASIERMRVVDVNTATLKMYHASSKDALLTRLPDVLGTIYPALIVDELVAIAEGRSTYERGEHVNFTLDDKLLNIWLRWVVMPGHEQTMGRVLVTIEDLTEHRQLEEQRLAWKLERERVQVLSRFIGDASHDLNTAITVLKTTLYLLKRQSADTQQPRLEVMNEQILRLQTMIEDMLTVTRFEQRTQATLVMQRVDLNSTILRLVAYYQNIGTVHQQRISYAATQLPPVKAQPVMLEQALEALLDNALKHTPEGTQVEVKTRLDAGQVTISVSDNGPGIAPEVLPHIFDYFFRGESHRPQSSGMGLGLGLARNLITAHGGTLTVTSELGVGTTFQITLPLEATAIPTGIV